MSTILVVDDSEVDRRLVAGMLAQEESYTIQLAHNGNEAVSFLQQSSPDLVLADLFMPGIDGMELLQVIRREFPLIPVVLMTSRGSEEIAVQALQNGAASYVPKHLLRRYLLTTVRNLLAQARERRSRARLLGSMRASNFAFSMENDAALIPIVVGFLQESMSHMGMGDGTGRLRISVALEEAITNAVNHGNLEVPSELRQDDDSRYYELIRQRSKEEPYRGRRVHIKNAHERSRCRICVIRDEGPGFDVASPTRSYGAGKPRTSRRSGHIADEDVHG